MLFLNHIYLENDTYMYEPNFPAMLCFLLNLKNSSFP